MCPPASRGEGAEGTAFVRPCVRAPLERFRLAPPKQLRFEIFITPARLSANESQVIATLSASNQRTKELVLARRRLLAIRKALRQSRAPTR